MKWLLDKTWNNNSCYSKLIGELCDCLYPLRVRVNLILKMNYDTFSALLVLEAANRVVINNK